MGDQFEDKLVSRLGYRGPWDLFEMLCGIIDREGEDIVIPISDQGEGVVQSAVSGSSASSGDSSGHHSSDTENSRETNKIDSSIGTSPHTHSLKAVTLSKYPKRGCWRILDLGCGSGLCGKVFQELVSHSGPNAEGESVQRDESRSVEVSDVLGVDTDVGMVIALAGSSDVEGEREREDDDLYQLERLRTCCAAVSNRQKGEGTDEGRGCMIGVDVSMRMVEITRRSGCYDCAGRADLSAALSLFERTLTPSTSVGNVDKSHGHAVTGQSSGAGLLALDLIIAADTFIYVGALGSVFSHVRKALGAGGIFLFSTEDLDSSPMRVTPHTGTHTAVEEKETGARHRDTQVQADKEIEMQADAAPLTNRIEVSQHSIIRGGEVVQVRGGEPVGAVPGWGGQLLKSARFAHSNAYIQILAEIHGFHVLMQRNVVLRTEETIPLLGILYLLQVKE